MLQAIRQAAVACEDTGPDLPPLPDGPREMKKATVIIFLSQYALIFRNKTVHGVGEMSLG